MPNLNVCTGHAFSVGPSGELIVAGSNSNAWPFAGPIATNNGLNTDAAQGLWTAPHGCYSKYVTNTATGLTGPVDSTHSYQPFTTSTFTNPSSAQQARLMAWTQVRMNVTVAAATLLQMIGATGFVGGSGGANAPIVPCGNPTASAVAAAATLNTTSEILVAPGATATLNCNPAMMFLGGAAGSQVTAYWVDVLFVAILLDPTQAGGIT